MATYKLTSAVAANICEYVLTQSGDIADGAEGTAALQAFLSTLLVYDLTNGAEPVALSQSPVDSETPNLVSNFATPGDVIRAILNPCDKCDRDLIRCFDIIERAIDAANGGTGTALIDNAPVVQLQIEDTVCCCSCCK